MEGFVPQRLEGHCGEGIVGELGLLQAQNVGFEGLEPPFGAERRALSELTFQVAIRTSGTLQHAAVCWFS